MLVRLACGLENLPHWACRIGLANAAYNRCWLAISDVSTWIKCVRAFIRMRSGKGGSTQLHLAPKSD